MDAHQVCGYGKSSRLYKGPERFMMIIEAVTDQEIERCFPVMRQLRAHIDGETFVASIRKLEEEGYVLAYLEENGEIKSVAGFREQTNFFLGKHLYVEDLVTDEAARSKGYGEMLFAWLCERGRQSGCSAIDLDSGTQRHGAHKFYLSRDMRIACYHFVKDLHE